MSNDKAVQEWLKAARLDLTTAEILFERDDLLLPIVAYHSQQAGEKSIKALLVFKNKRPLKTHNISDLLNMLNSLDNTLAEELEEALKLTPFAVANRYPDAIKIPITRELCGELIDIAKSTMKRVIKKI